MYKYVLYVENGEHTCRNTLRKLDVHFLSNLMEYDRGDSFHLHLEPNVIPFGSKSKVKPSPRSYSIQFKRKSYVPE